MEPDKYNIRTLQVGMNWFPEQPGNGLDRVFHALAEHLPGAGVDVCGLVVGSEEVKRSTDGRVEAFASGDVPLPKRLYGVRQSLRRGDLLAQTDIVAAHFALYALPVLDLVRDSPFVVHFHGPWAGESRAEGEANFKVKAKSIIEGRVYRRADRFVVLSEAFRDVLMQRYKVCGEKVKIVPGGVDVDRFDTGVSRQQAREQLGWPADRPITLSVRRLVRRVGLENLVTAMKQVRRQVPEALLLIAGKGPLRSELEARIEAAGLNQNVQLLGFVPDDDLPLAYRAADVSVVPTVSLEGFGLIAAESLAAGTPVLVTPVGGLPEVVQGLDEKLVLPSTDPAELADHLAAALTGNKPLPDAAACQAYAQSRFAWPVIARQVRSVYEGVC